MKKVSIVKDDISFNKESKLVYHDECQKNKWYTLTSEFIIDDLNSQTLLKIACGGYAEIYINNHFAFRMNEKFYIFDLPYKTIDISSFISNTDNHLTILYCSNGDDKRDGCIFEISNNNNVVLFSDDRVKSGMFAPINDNSPFFIEAGADIEIFDSSKVQRIDSYAQTNHHTLSLSINETKFDSNHNSTLPLPNEKQIKPKYVSNVHTVNTTNLYAKNINAHDNNHGYYFTYLSSGINKKVKIFFSNESSDFYYNNQKIKLGDTIELCPEKRLLVTYSSSFDICIKGVDNVFSLDWFFIRIPKIEYSKPFFPWNDARFIEKFDMKYVLSQIGNGKNERCLVSDIDINLMNNNTVIKACCPINKKDIKLNYPINETVDINNSKKKKYFVIDFGKVNIGLLNFKVKNASKNKRIICHLFEGFDNSNGFIKFMPKRMTINYITNGKNPTFSSHVRRGFRYALFITENDECDMNICDISITNLSYAKLENYSFVSNDEKLNSIYNMCIDTCSSCMVDTYIDCPGYEQNPWTGDAYVTSLINLLNFGDFDYDRHYHYLIALSMSDGLTKYYRTNNPRYINRKFLPCATFPTYPEGNIPIWSYMWVLDVYDHYMITDDIEFIKTMLPVIEETLKRSEKLLSKRYLLSIDGAWNLIEWANNDLSMCGEAVANSILLSACFQRYSLVENTLGNSKKSSHYNQLSQKIKDAINTYGFDKTKMAYTDMVRDEFGYEIYKSYYEKVNKPYHSYDNYLLFKKISVQTNTLALYYDIVPNEYVGSTLKYLIDNITSGLFVPGTPSNCNFSQLSNEYVPDGYVHIGSPFFMFYAYNCLAKYGKYDLILKSIIRDYDYVFTKDIRTTIETFIIDGIKDTRSFCHAWSSSPAIVLKREIAGVKMLKPSYKEFTIEPHLGYLNEIKCSIPTPYGEISIKIIKKNDGKYAITCKHPKECKYIK